MIKIFVGSLNTNTTEEQLRALFEPYGKVEFVNIVLDRETNKPRGIAFVTMWERDEGEKAITELDRTELNGNILVINEARIRQNPRPDNW